MKAHLLSITSTGTTGERTGLFVQAQNSPKYDKKVQFTEVTPNL